MLMSYVCDMDGVIYHGSRLIPSALEFVRAAPVSRAQVPVPDQQ